MASEPNGTANTDQAKSLDVVSFGRGCGSAVDAGKLTRMSTVASGAATVKMINSTNNTSMNG